MVNFFTLLFISKNISKCTYCYFLQKFLRFGYLHVVPVQDYSRLA